VTTTGREPNRYCSVGGTVSSCTRTDVFYSLAATEPVSYRLRAAWTAWQRRTFHPLPVCDRVRRDSGLQ